MELKRVVITGMGAQTPLGNNVADYWQGLLSGVSGAAPITLFDVSRFKTRFACEVKDFDPGKYFDRKEARKLDRFSQLAVAACEEAVIDAGLLENKPDPDRTGVIWGSGIGRLRTFRDEEMS